MTKQSLRQPPLLSVLPIVHHAQTQHYDSIQFALDTVFQPWYEHHSIEIYRQLAELAETTQEEWVFSRVSLHWGQLNRVSAHYFTPASTREAKPATGTALITSTIPLSDGSTVCPTV